MFTYFPLSLSLSLSLSHTHTNHTVQIQRRQLTSTNRRPAACHRTTGTCNYYSGCLEPQFRCGSTGFLLQYAQKRCEAARYFASCSGSNCVRNEEIVRWSNKVETCIQNGLQNVIARDFSNSEVESDPVTCLSFERKAMQKINECYRNPEGKSVYDQPELCKLLSSNISEQVHQDLTNLVKAFNVGGEYHVSTVDSGIPELVRQCGHSEVADSLYIGQPTFRVIFCAWGYDLRNGQDNVEVVNPDQYVRFLSQHFNDDETHFQYGGTGWNSRCALHGPASSQESYTFHVITWFALPNNTMAQNWNVTQSITDQIGTGFLSFFEYTQDRSDYLANRIRDNSKCGNGRRDPGEMCDYALLNSSVCSLKCEIEPSADENGDIYECSTDRLNRSYCWPQQCGDGKKTSAEKCDDGNHDNNDGCSSQCQIETSQFTCKNSYNGTSLCRPLPPIRIATQRQITRSSSNIVHAKHTESAPLQSTIVDMPLDTKGLSSARRLISRTGLVLLTVVLTTLWTTLTLA